MAPTEVFSLDSPIVTVDYGLFKRLRQRFGYICVAFDRFL